MSETEKEMTIWEHIDDLRKNLLIAVIGLAITTAISFTFASTFLNYLAMPIGGLDKLQSIEVTENVGAFMRIALLGGVILAMPIIVYELLNFILPGLTSNERKYIYISVPAASLLFLAGTAFAYFVMLPAAIPFMISFLNVKTNVRLSNYISFTTSLMFWIGVAFETPLLIFVLAKFHIVNARQLVRFWRYAVVIIAVLAGAITPTVDPVNMSLLMLPLMVIYGVSIILAWFAAR